MSGVTAADAGVGLYVHIPVCVSRCHYCDFHSEARAEVPWPAFAAALCRELDARAPLFAGLSLRSIYFGGGTPSLAPPTFFSSLLDAVRGTFDSGSDREVTVEANPQDLRPAWLDGLGRLGVNRLSLGWQSSRDETLRLLGRRHSAAEGRDAVALAKAAGFDNLSLDLIFAVPGETRSELDADLACLLACEPAHVSTYALTYHPGTELDRMRRAGEVTPLEEDDEAAMMLRIEDSLVDAGFEHYEVSNYARAGRRALHNSLYWAGSRYLGVGPGAHSFWHEGWQRGWRWESVRGLDRYLAVWAAPQPPGLPAARHGSASPAVPSVSFREELSPRQLMTERMLCGLRTTDGVDLCEPALRPFVDRVTQGAAKAEMSGWLRRDGTRLLPTAQGLLVADAMAALFF